MLTDIIQIANVVVAVISALAAIYAVIKVKELHIIVNSRLTELLERSGKAQRAEGKEEGVKEERLRREG